MADLHLSGVIVHGKGKGGPSGFPTANLSLGDGFSLPPTGVYAATVCLDGNSYVGVTNIGTRPTADASDEMTIETLIDGFSGIVYDHQMTLDLRGYLRPIRRFSSMEELRIQIEADLQAAKQFLRGELCGVGFLTSSAAQTQALGRMLAAQLLPGDIVTLHGDLGAGKSELARGIARGLGISCAVPSPSFTILNVYDQGKMPLYHFDWYRIEDENELEEMGVEEQLNGDGVSLIEWSERAEDFLPTSRLSVFIHPLDETTRSIRLIPNGQFHSLNGAQLLEASKC